LGGKIINLILYIIAGIAAVSCLFGAITYLVSISNEIQNPDIEESD
jgi:hypothetical protein